MYSILGIKWYTVMFSHPLKGFPQSVLFAVSCLCDCDVDVGIVVSVSCISDVSGLPNASESVF